MFDQPDLKGTFQLNLIIDKEWVGVTNEPCTSISTEFPEEVGIAFPNINQNEVYHVFGKTPELSSYLFVVIAGRYECVTAEEKYGDMELRLFSRRSLFTFAKE
mmetsp:Transcript_26518/g.23498  ORF Transcript_26518/g.23498 Transcript_26518/m.23498 type:complete len:103 (+) Transcript_26518:508-816(+)